MLKLILKNSKFIYEGKDFVKNNLMIQKNAKQIDVQQLCLDHQLEIVNQSAIKK